MLREVRWNSMVFILVSRRVMVLETVAWDRDSSAAALANEPVSATLAKIAQPSRSGSLFMVILAKKVASMIAAGYVTNKNAREGRAGNTRVMGIMQKRKGCNSRLRILRRRADP